MLEWIKQLFCRHIWVQKPRRFIITGVGMGRWLTYKNRCSKCNKTKI